jgi:hypothetical protein
MKLKIILVKDILKMAGKKYKREKNNSYLIACAPSKMINSAFFLQQPLLTIWKILETKYENQVKS